ncbi:MAG: YceD family protein [Vagococcus sp.]
MKWALAELNKYRNSQLEFDETLDLEQSLKERESTILALTPVKVNGFIRVDKESYLSHFTLDTCITLPSSRSLEPVDVSLNLTIDEEYMTHAQMELLVDVSEDDKSLIMLLEKDIIDLTEAVEDFILLNLPLQVLTEAEKEATDLPKGDFWSIVSEEEFSTNRDSEMEIEVDPRLAKLSELFAAEDDE